MKSGDTINKNNKQCILIVEDNEQINTLLKNALDNYHIICTHNGIEALQILQSRPGPDLIISDILMEEMDGYDFFNIVSDINELKKIPFIFLTAKKIEKEKIHDLSQRGKVDIMIKPFSISGLKAKIEAMLR